MHKTRRYISILMVPEGGMKVREFKVSYRAFGVIKGLPFVLMVVVLSAGVAYWRAAQWALELQKYKGTIEVIQEMTLGTDSTFAQTYVPINQALEKLGEAFRAIEAIKVLAKEQEAKIRSLAKTKEKLEPIVKMQQKQVEAITGYYQNLLDQKAKTDRIFGLSLLLITAIITVSTALFVKGGKRVPPEEMMKVSKIQENINSVSKPQRGT